MSSAVLELQGAIVSRLKAYSAVTAIVGPRTYDTIPAGASFPYVSMGPSDEITVEADCIDGLDISFQVDCWSRTLGYPEVRLLADAVRLALHDQDLQLDANALVYLKHRQTRVFREPDELTSHAVLTFEAFAENS